MHETRPAPSTRGRPSATQITLAAVTSLLLLGACGSDRGGSAAAAPPATDSVNRIATMSPPATRTVTLAGHGTIDYHFDTPAADGTGTYAGTEVLTGDIQGSVEAKGTYVMGSGPDKNGTGTRTIAGRVAGIGEGTLTLSYRWTYHGEEVDSVGEITGGTGDFRGATGRAESHAAKGAEVIDYTLSLTLPADRFDASFGESPASTTTG